MKKYTITVNGTAYEVEVEDMGGAAATAPKAAAPKAAPAPAAAPAPKAAAPAPAAAPAAVAAPVQDDSEVIAVIAAAVAALGHSAEQIACVRRLPEASWTQNAHIEAISVRKECF